MDEQAFRDFLAARRCEPAQVAAALEAVRELEGWLAAGGEEIATAPLASLERYIAALVADGRNDRRRLLDLARYCGHVKRNDFYIHFMAFFVGEGVYDSIAEAVERVAGKAVREEIFRDFAAPPLGTPPPACAPVTRRLMERLQEALEPGQLRQVLAGNHHRIPAEGFAKHKQWYAELGDIDAFLKKVHDEAVAELAQHMREGNIWYEQEITPEYLEYVRANQEILSAVRRGDKLTITKIPYAGKEFLRETDPVMKRYHACHCPLARASILTPGATVDAAWCYCSGGYQKLMFDVVFGVDTEVELLESVLRGDPRCRFAVTIPAEALARG